MVPQLSWVPRNSMDSLVNYRQSVTGLENNTCNLFPSGTKNMHFHIANLRRLTVQKFHVLCSTISRCLKKQYCMVYLILGSK